MMRQSKTIIQSTNAHHKPLETERSIENCCKPIAILANLPPEVLFLLNGFGPLSPIVRSDSEAGLLNKK